MTGYALYTTEFVLHERFSVPGYFLVASRTFRSGMFSSQFEPGFIMIKSFDRPFFHVVALRTGHYAVDCKLGIVRVRMAIGAGSRGACKAAISVFRIGHMAIPAFLPGMRPLQFEVGFVVVKFIFSPSRRFVAFRAGLVRVPFFRNLPDVHICMTIHTTLSQSPEFPFSILLVAGKTRGRYMRSCERKLRSSVVFQGKQAF